MQAFCLIFGFQLRDLTLCLAVFGSCSLKIQKSGIHQNSEQFKPNFTTLSVLAGGGGGEQTTPNQTKLHCSKLTTGKTQTKLHCSKLTTGKTKTKLHCSKLAGKNKPNQTEFYLIIQSVLKCSSHHLIAAINHREKPTQSFISSLNSFIFFPFQILHFSF